MELGAGIPDRYKKITFWKNWIDELFVKIFVESYQTAPDEIILDVDTTDLPLHGKQEGRFFHGYYDNYCYLPLYIFCGEQILVRAVAGSQPRRFVWQPCGNLENRNADSGGLAESENHSARRGGGGGDELMSWCENNGVDFVFGLARNQRLRRIIGAR